MLFVGFIILALSSTVGVTLMDKLPNSVIRERCGVREGVLTKIEIEN